jgi:hypothetical protein
MRIPSAVLVLLLLPAGQALAQTDPNWTVGATVGFAKTTDDEGSIGDGWALGGYADRRLTKRLDFELSADVIRNRRTDNFQVDGHTTYLSGLLVGRFGPRRSQFLLMGGPSVAVYRGTTGFASETLRNEHRSTNPGLMGGVGLSFRTANDIEIAPLMRMTMMRIEVDSDPWAMLTFGIRVGFGR